MTHGPAQISTVTNAAASTNLIDLATVKLLLDVTSNELDGYFKTVIPMASRAAQNFCNRIFVVETVLDRFWPARDGYPGIVRGGVAPLQLSRWPLVEVVSVVETRGGEACTLVADVDYLADPAKGQLVRLDRNAYPTAWLPNPIAATFSAGYDPIEADLVDAVMRMIKGAYFARKRDPQLRGETAVGIYEAQYWFGAGPGASGGLPPDIAEILENYRSPVIA